MDAARYTYITQFVKTAYSNILKKQLPIVKGYMYHQRLAYATVSQAFKTPAVAAQLAEHL